MNPIELKEKALSWMKGSAFPFWLSHVKDGIFPEAFDTHGKDLYFPFRTMVQARMVYCLAKGIDFKMVEDVSVLKRTIENLINLQNANGSLPYSFDSSLKVKEDRSELYTQAFVLFALGHAHRIDPNAGYEKPAMALMDYLERQRSCALGGFTEFDEKGGPYFRSNPHMHLFEALLIWSEMGAHKRWKNQASRIFSLFQTKFIQSDGVVAEYFDSTWTVENRNGHFIWEPGHQYEWAWLLSEMDRILGSDTKNIQTKLFKYAEKKGICLRRRVAFDLMDSEVLKSTSRYWPQAERVKAALKVPQNAQTPLIADEAMRLMMEYLATPVAGLCFDHKQESGEFSKEVARASFLYHVINAMDEYIRYR